MTRERLVPIDTLATIALRYADLILALRDALRADSPDQVVSVARAAVALADTPPESRA